MGEKFRVDFFTLLDNNCLERILQYLDKPAELVRVGVVSKYARDAVITRGLFKQLCLRMFPILHNVDRVTEPNSSDKSLEIGCSTSTEREELEKEHRVYYLLAHRFVSCVLKECLLIAISASSTDIYPKNRINNTLKPWRTPYWSSKGQRDPSVPEMLTYKLADDICVITEISIQPFQDILQQGKPVYSAKSVRFRMGHVKPSKCDPMGFIWTYTSPEFAMAQEGRLQHFKLPEPILCIGGIFQVELLGRVQTQEMDGLYYICVSRVQVEGRPLSAEFRVKVLEEPSGKFELNNTFRGVRTPNSNNKFAEWSRVLYYGDDEICPTSSIRG